MRKQTHTNTDLAYTHRHTTHSHSYRKAGNLQSRKISINSLSGTRVCCRDRFKTETHSAIGDSENVELRCRRLFTATALVAETEAEAATLAESL